MQIDDIFCADSMELAMSYNFSASSLDGEDRSLSLQLNDVEN